MSPWFFMEYNVDATYGFGVKPGCNAFCSWPLSEGKCFGNGHNTTGQVRSFANLTARIIRSMVDHHWTVWKNF